MGGTGTKPHRIALDASPPVSLISSCQYSLCLPILVLTRLHFCAQANGVQEIRPHLSRLVSLGHGRRRRVQAKSGAVLAAERGRFQRHFPSTVVPGSGGGRLHRGGRQRREASRPVLVERHRSCDARRGCPGLLISISHQRGGQHGLWHLGVHPRRGRPRGHAQRPAGEPGEAQPRRNQPALVRGHVRCSLPRVRIRSPVNTVLSVPFNSTAGMRTRRFSMTLSKATATGGVVTLDSSPAKAGMPSRGWARRTFPSSPHWRKSCREIHTSTHHITHARAHTTKPNTSRRNAFICNNPRSAL